MPDTLQLEIDAYLAEHWDDVVGDIESLVSIESVEDLGAAAPGSPFGPGPRAALDRALAIAEGMGLDVCDCEGHIGYADLPGKSATQIGIIGHVDVVPAGPGWHFDPFAVTRKEGYLLGRGVFDDKGPIVVALHAVGFWAQKAARTHGGDDARLPYTVRVLFGANEETNMKDVAYYRAGHDDPAFLFTPDAEFPVCYGEAGICSGTLTSASLAGGALVDISGGVAVNAVPGEAQAILACAVEALPNPAVSAGRIAVEDASADAAGIATGKGAEGAGVTAHAKGADGTIPRTRVRACGKSAHASTPELGVNAIDVLAEYLLGAGLLSADERRFLELVRAVTAASDGSGLGVQTSDGHFGALTAVGGTISFDGERIRLTIDFRYPTTTTAAEIEARVRAVAAEANATFAMEHDKAPFLMDPLSPTVQAMLSAYNEATGEQALPFTMKGGTYARVFTTGVSFGPGKPWEVNPDWVGGMHGPDEGVREDLLKQAFAIYVRTIGKLMELEL